MSQTRELSDPLLGAVVAGRYHVVRRLAAGGMGVVYEARQEPLGRRVALKVIRGDATDPVARQRFEREARAASALQDPHVVVVHDFGIIDEGEARGGLYLAMEFLEGETLRQRLGTSGRLTWEKSRPVVRQIAQALAAAHARGLVHRDLKPENVILAVSDRHEVSCKVLDFGLAKGTGTDTLLQPSGSPLTRSGGFVGTPGYISPEVIDGAAEDPRQDVYALGVVWWELLTGRHPFPAETPMKTLVRQMHEDPPILDDVLCLSDGIPADGARLIQEMMAREPRYRPLDGGAVLGRLAQLFGDTRPDDRLAGEHIDSNAATIAASRSSVSSLAPSSPSSPSSSPSSSSPAEALTVEARRKAVPTPSPSSAAITQTAPPPSSSSSSSSSSSPSSSPSLLPSTTTTPSVPTRRRWLRPRQRLFVALLGASVLGTAGGMLVLRTIEARPPPPPPPPPVPTVPAIAFTEVIIDGVPTYVALKQLRDRLPPHTMRLYRSGHAELSMTGDVGSRVADLLLETTFVVDVRAFHIDVESLDPGRVVARVLEDALEGTDAGVVELDDAGVDAVPGGLEP